MQPTCARGICQKAIFNLDFSEATGLPELVAKPGAGFVSSLSQNAFHPRKGKPAARRRRKAMGHCLLGQTFVCDDGCQAAEGVDRR